MSAGVPEAMRRVDAFFYGLNMDAALLRSRGVAPLDPRLAWVEDHAVRLCGKAVLLRSRGARAGGILYRLSHAELDALYAGLPDYRPEPLLARLHDGTPVAAIGWVQDAPNLEAPPDPAYAAHWQRLVAALGLDAITLPRHGD